MHRPEISRTMRLLQELPIKYKFIVEIVLFIKCFIKVGHDPDANRWDRIKQEESKLREAMRKVSQVKRTKVI